MYQKKCFYVYILASRYKGTPYVGITNDIKSRVFEHKEGKIKGFTQKYNVKRLVYYEDFDYVNEAIEREKKLKKWPRRWKIKIIDEMNPSWKDLYPEACANDPF